ncbi:MAG TPA: hypothetical protein PLS03_06765 [Terrimicrobiaceae bacterium]|nr:hypothetical protein [Terrimicrobiaceae bacterium]
MPSDAEADRISARDQGREHWELWGPYLPERQWGTVREDYSANGDAWTYFPHDQARSRVYRWGEDGLLGICDSDCRMCFSLALWNGKDPILKERPFGLSNPQGNHGEDLKEYFYHLDNTPTHSYMRGLYKYPQGEFPYQQLIDENARRSRLEPEYELVDTGIFQEGRYFDVFIEYAKFAPNDIGIRISAVNRGPDPAPLTLLPTLWFRNTWSWGQEGVPKPEMHLGSENSIKAAPWGLPVYHLYCEGAPEFVFTDNETNNAKLFQARNASAHVKDAFHDFIIHGNTAAVNPALTGTKAAAIYRRMVASGETSVVNLRLSEPPQADPFGKAFQTIFTTRSAETDAFYESITPGLPSEPAMLHRRALAGLLWCKKFYYWPVIQWLIGDPTMPKPPDERWNSPNAFWKSLHAHDVISMPDCWEYPYFCAWDLMFHSVAFAFIDPATAKRQNMLLRGERYTSPSAQMPAYEWALSDANPPIGGWAAWRIYSIERASTGTGDREFLKKAFNKLLMGYAWWANRVDQTGDNVFEGGFLGLDNIGVFDRRYPLPDGSTIEQSDGTAWMATYALHMLNIAIELAREDPAYEDIADKFLNDFIYLAAAINARSIGGYTLWDDEDGFYYDVLKRPDGTSDYLKTRSLVGLTPLFAVESFDDEAVRQFPLLRRRVEWFQKHRPHLLDQLHHIGVEHGGKRLISLVPPERLRRLCERLFDEKEFLSPHGIRALSRVYLDHPYTFTEGGQTETLTYSPADSPVAMFGGNSNWRGPVWMPMNYLLIEALQKFGFYFGDSFKVEFPTGSGVEMTLWEISLELEKRLVSIFERDEHGNRPFNGSTELFQTDPHWRDHILFNEYFNGDNGAGVGASHQTGWTALVAKMIRQLHSFERNL